MLLQSIFIYCLLIFGVTFADELDAVNEASRDKRGLDFGVFLKNLLQNSAALSSSTPTTRAPMAPRSMPNTTTTTTTTTTAPPPPPPPMPPIFQRTFYKTIPGVGGLGFGFNFGGNVGNPPFVFPNDPRGGFIDFDYNDGAMSTPPMPTTAAPEMTAMTTPMPTTMTTTMMQAQPAPQPVPMRRRPMPFTKMQRRPAQSPSAQQPSPRVIYKYVPAPYFNAHTPSLDYYDSFNAAQKSQPPSYDYPAFFNARPAPNVAVARPRSTPPPAPAPAPARPTAAAPISTPNGPAELSDNLIYQFVPTDDIYSKDDGAPNDVTAGDAINFGVESSNDAADANDSVANAPDGANLSSTDAEDAAPNAVDDSGNNNNNDAINNSPSPQQSNANFDYADNSQSSEISGPYRFDPQNYGYVYDDHQNKVPYPLKPSAQKPGLFVYANQPPIDDISSHIKRPGNPPAAYASMRFQTPFSSFHSSTVNHGHTYNGGLQTQQTFYK